MTDTKKLREIIARKGVKYKILAESIGITPYALQRKIDNEREFKASEIVGLSDFLGLTPGECTEIFLMQK